ncbi:Retrovirus-related Pol polyprotein from transposon TNT 1-94 [Gossypium australe]|uniref:Retrovirus-related Pol polyprotein from transposon TNT 1-94 n=1 Tax=Gossypium australe TaxID=47621 RepID=A0A5B6WPU2_9ROSI|nr:Retrovirus-related Pol polyprotein from transposon TNT 1-94 [Gossypium australe]
MNIKFANCLDPYMDLSKHLAHRIKDLIKQSRILDLSKTNNVGTLSSVKLWLTQQFSMKNLGEANFVRGIQILRD